MTLSYLLRRRDDGARHQMLMRGRANMFVHTWPGVNAWTPGRLRERSSPSQRRRSVAWTAAIPARCSFARLHASYVLLV